LEIRDVKRLGIFGVETTRGKRIEIKNGKPVRSCDPGLELKKLYAHFLLSFKPHNYDIPAKFL
jgi:hypothetical protein